MIGGNSCRRYGVGPELGNIGRNPSRLILRQQVSVVAPGFVFFALEAGVIDGLTLSACGRAKGMPSR